MRGKTGLFATATMAALFVAGLLLVSTNFARAQQASAGSGDGASSAPSVATQPDKKAPPENFAGCWDGTGTDGSLDDLNYGSGVGWIGIVQKGKRITGGKNHSYYEFLFDDGAFAYGSLAGKATATGFKLTAKAGGSCRIFIIGTFGTSNDNIVGSYESKHCKNFDAAGTFDLPYEPSGCVFVTPPQ